jgi:hypothetical protein
VGTVLRFLAAVPLIAAVIFVFSAINNPAGTGAFVGDAVQSGWSDVTEFVTSLDGGD